VEFWYFESWKLDLVKAMGVLIAPPSFLLSNLGLLRGG